MATLASAQSGLAIWGAWRDEDEGGGGGGVCRLGACATLKTFARFDNSESFSGCSAVVALMRFASALNGSPAARQCRVGQVDVALHLPLSFPSPWTDCANSWAASCLLGRRRRRRDERFINIKTMQVVNNWLSDNPLKSPCVFVCEMTIWLELNIKCFSFEMNLILANLSLSSDLISVKTNYISKVKQVREVAWVNPRIWKPNNKV